MKTFDSWLQAISALSVKMDGFRDIIKCFDGRNAEVETWLEKVKLVAKLKEVKKLAAFIPLYLEAEAFSVYNQLSAEDKDDENKIEQALLSAFACDLYKAYDSLRQRCLKDGESVDAFVADLRRLARMAKVEHDQVIQSAFVCGLPYDVSNTLRSSSGIATMDLSTIVSQARILMGNRSQSAVMIAGRNHQKQSRVIPECYICKKSHQIGRCPEWKSTVSCWRCGAKGHLARECQGNENGTLLPAQTVSQKQ